MVRVIYGGSPEASASTLSYLLNESTKGDFKIVGVLTNPPAAKGRHSDLIPTPVAQTAQIWNEARGDDIKIMTPEHLKEAEREEISALNPDIFVCFAYGHIVGPKFLSLFRYGAINLHPSLLPKYRGATPVNSAILNMDAETGFTVQKMSLGIDEGDILSQVKITLTGNETTEYLLNRSATEGAVSIAEILTNIAGTGSLPPSTPQTGEASYCTIIRKEDGKIDWSKSAKAIDAQIRAYTPWPGCYTTVNGVTLKLLKTITAEMAGCNKKTDAKPGTVIEYSKQHGILIQTGDGILVARELQWNAKKAMDYKSFMNGARDFIGSVME